MGDEMGRGKRIQDFRNLNLNSLDQNNESFDVKKLKSGSELVIEVEEKPKKPYKNIPINRVKNSSNKQSATKNKEKVSLKQKRKSSKTYIEKETERKRKEERKKTSMWISSFLLTFIFVGIVAGCLVTPTFDVTEILVEDGINIKASEIQGYFSMVKGKNTFLVDKKSIEEELEKHPYIYQAEISREFPNKLKVQYLERKQYASIKYIESYIFLDKYGYVLEIKQENTNTDIPVIYGIEKENFISGNKLEGVAALKYENIVYLIETAESAKFNYTITKINYTDLDEVELDIKEADIKVIYGEIQKELLSDKIMYLNEVLKKLDGKRGILDISNENYTERGIFSEKIN